MSCNNLPSMYDLDAGHPLFLALSKHVYHATSPANYLRIADEGVLRPNLGDLPNSSPQSTSSRARILKAISFFDFTTPAQSVIFESINHYHWTTMLQILGTPIGILLGFNISDLHDHWISYESAKSRVPEFCFMLPDVEACYQGPIPISLIKSQIVYSGLSPNLFRVFDDGIISASTLYELEIIFRKRKDMRY